jgi:hypothetical protein
MFDGAPRPQIRDGLLRKTRQIVICITLQQ